MKIKILTYGILSMLVISSCKKQDNDAFLDTTSDSKNVAQNSVYVSDTSPKIVAYFPSYRDPATVSASKYALITHIYYAFLTPDANGNLNPLPNPTRFNSVVATAKANKVLVGVSVTGASNLAIVAADPTKRTNLVNNLVNFVVSNNLDGLDMDWEFPRTTDGTSVTYAALMSQLSSALHAQNKYLSAAITAGVYAGAVRDAILTEVFDYVDFFNIMSYDGLGWDSAEPNQHSSYNMAQASLNYWATTRGMPKHKVILGFPSYGRSNSTSASATFSQLVSAGASTSSDYFTYNGFPYGYNGTTTITSKTNLAKSMGNGVMIWEIYGDIDGSNSLLQAAKTALGAGSFDNFQTSVGRFNKAPTYSGSTVGIATTSTASHYVSGSETNLRVTLNDNTSVTTPWKVRLLSGDGTPANNVSLPKTGVIYFWLKTSTAGSGATVRVWLDDSDGTEQSATIPVINDGAWHKYQWNLSGSGFSAVTGNGVLTASNLTLDAIVLEKPNGASQWISYIDNVGR